MTIDVFYGGMTIFIMMLFIHILIWRLISVKKEIFWLFFIFLGIPALFLLALAYWEARETLYIISVGALYGSCALIYIQTYPAIKIVIPTFKILLLLNDHPGLKEAEIVETLSEEGSMFLDKIEELENDVLIFKEKGVFQLTYFGHMLAQLFIMYRRILNLEKGVG